MNRTFAYNSIWIGVLVGILVAVSTEKALLGILAGLAVAIGGFFLIRLIEKALGKGIDAATDAAARAINNRKNKGN